MCTLALIKLLYSGNTAERATHTSRRKGGEIMAQTPYSGSISNGATLRLTSLGLSFPICVTGITTCSKRCGAENQVR